jgi:pyruvate dehydrogenase E2 component (dihydrolipoamide acetyltransferase)
MAEVVIMPKLGFDMAEGTLVRWVIAEGEPVAKGAVLAEIETDKATVEVESAFEGFVLKHLVSQGESVPINTPIEWWRPGRERGPGRGGASRNPRGEPAPRPPKPPAAGAGSTGPPDSRQMRPAARRAACLSWREMAFEKA